MKVKNVRVYQMGNGDMICSLNKQAIRALHDGKSHQIDLITQDGEESKTIKFILMRDTAYQRIVTKWARLEREKMERAKTEKEAKDLGKDLGLETDKQPSSDDSEKESVDDV